MKARLLAVLKDDGLRPADFDFVISTVTFSINAIRRCMSADEEKTFTLELNRQVLHFGVLRTIYSCFLCHAIDDFTGLIAGYKRFVIFGSDDDEDLRNLRSDTFDSTSSDEDDLALLKGIHFLFDDSDDDHFPDPSENLFDEDAFIAEYSEFGQAEEWLIKSLCNRNFHPKLLKRLSGARAARAATLRFIQEFDAFIDKYIAHPANQLDAATKCGLGDIIPRFIDNVSTHMFDCFKRNITDKYQCHFERMFFDAYRPKMDKETYSNKKVAVIARACYKLCSHDTNFDITTWSYYHQVVSICSWFLLS